MNSRQTMASYDTGTLTLSSMNVAQHDILRLTAPDHGALNLNHMDPFDHDLNFEGDLLSSDPNLPFTPSYELSDAFGTTFEDPFSYTTGPFESLLEDPTSNTTTDPTPSSLDNKLLSFSAPLIHSTILTSTNTQTWPSMSAELYGMFFVAEDVFGGETTGRPMELTCYRRNLFQISGNITLSRDITHIINENGQSVPIFDLTASISAVESIEGKATEIISVPWKTSSSSGTSSSEEKAGLAPPKCPLDLSLNPELDTSCVTIPIAWKRLQFKHATANNGRRKGLQQHYVIRINLLATTGMGGEGVLVAEIQSGPIIVRGRSPRNFDGRRDVPLSERKEGKGRAGSDAAGPVKVDPAVTSSSYRFYTMNQVQQPLDLPDWSSQATGPLPSPTDSRPFKKPLQSLPPQHSQQTRPPIPKTKWPSSNSSISSSTSKYQISAPIDLSLADEEYRGHQGRGSPEIERRKGMSGGARGTMGGEGGKAGTGGGTGVGAGGGLGSPVENLELLYEYFPLSLDDWMPPVDAIYRPHVVHHTWPSDFKAQQVTNKTKRYFSADD